MLMRWGRRMTYQRRMSHLKQRVTDEFVAFINRSRRKGENTKKKMNEEIIEDSDSSDSIR